MGLTSYSSDQFYKDWVYAGDEDFKSEDGVPATYAPGQPCEWDSEHVKIPLHTEPGPESLNADGALLAVGLGHDIHIWTITNLKISLYQVLKGHISRVDDMYFHPKDPKMLVSCAMNHYGGSVRADPAIIFWNLDEQRRRALESENNIKSLATQAVGTIATGLHSSKSPWVLDSSEKTDLAQSIGEAITTLNVKSQLRDNTHIFGRFPGPTSGANAFNSTGTSMIFLPGDRPASNRVDKWDICILDVAAKRVYRTLEGHTDAIMWVGFSPDNKFIASVCWDKTFRIWDHATGTLLHTFHSKSQNWTGSFSPNSQLFAGSAGEGRVWVWDLTTGEQVITHESGTYDISLSSVRSINWSPDGKHIALGGGALGRLIIVSLATQSIVQKRVLSAKNCPEEARHILRNYLSVRSMQFIDGGRRIAYKTSGDNGVEVYDFVDNQKWRFAPGKGQSKGYGGGFLLLERERAIVSVDSDAVRFWKLDTGRLE
ncbi:hypothetical protein MMC16_005780 [Acarospora aff. strigata]|nr:hypothetical protein [Acarospora aff. strigata]